MRRIFQIEQEIKAALDAGRSAAAVRAELAGVRNGTVGVSMKLGREPKPRRNGAPAVTADRRSGPERRRAHSDPSGRGATSRKALEVDLADLAKGKIDSVGRRGR